MRRQYYKMTKPMPSSYLEKLRWDLLVFKYQDRLLSPCQKGRAVLNFSLCLVYHALHRVY